jgi:hypothetical protein
MVNREEGETPMAKIEKCILTLLALLMMSLPTLAQDSQAREGLRSSGSQVTISLTEGGIRLAALGSFGKMRLEVFNADSVSLYNSDFRTATVQDWPLEDKDGQRLADGTYLCVVTVRDLSGRLSTKQGSVVVKGGQPSLQMTDTVETSVVAQDKSLAPVTDRTDSPITLLGNDGNQGQVVNTRGALTFRLGDFFGGKDKELMRLTPEGNLGIGTSKPEFKLDVAGTIRAREGFIFRDGSTLNINDKGALTLSGSNGKRDLVLPGGGFITPNVLSTVNKLAKFTDTAGTVGDSAVASEVNGDTLDVAGRVTLSGNKTLSTPLAPMLGVNTTINNTALAGMALSVRGASFTGTGDLPTGLDVAPTFAPSGNISVAQGFVAAAFAAPPSGVTITDQIGGNSAIVYTNVTGAVTNGTSFNVGAPFVLGALRPTTQSGLRIRNQGIGGTPFSYGLYVDSQAGSTNSYAAIFAGGNVGIGTTTPQSPLDINGNLNVTGNATISGNIAAKYQDIAEWTVARTPLPSGTVVILDTLRPNAVMASNKPYDLRVAGVVSAQPGVSLGEAGPNKVLVATTGRVKVKVDANRAPIHIGDLLVSSNTPGVAMKSQSFRVNGKIMHRPGTIIGKALEPLAQGKGEILVLLSLQ